jgi:hypothetical protein
MAQTGESVPQKFETGREVAIGILRANAKGLRMTVHACGAEFILITDEKGSLAALRM